MKLAVTREVFPLVRPFTISRNSRSEAQVVTVTVSDQGLVGRGECVPYPRYGETIASTIAEIEAMRDFVEAGGDRSALQLHMAAGAARNGLDCALWDLEAKRLGIPVATQLGLDPAARVPTAITIGIDTPEAMAAEARGLADCATIKIKVDAADPMVRIRAVRQAAPEARLIVDPNESWEFGQLQALQEALAASGVALLEQPIPAADGEALDGFQRLVPICADEAAHTAADIPGLVGRYDYVNIKLDKTGGLTEAINLAREAQSAGLGVMVGCMLSSSLSIAPACIVAQLAEFTDLDGPYLFEMDREGGVRIEQGWIVPPSPGFWGD